MGCTGCTLSTRDPAPRKSAWQPLTNSRRSSPGRRPWKLPTASLRRSHTLEMKKSKKQRGRSGRNPTSAHAAFIEHCADQFDANSGFALQFHQVVVNVCADIARGLDLVVVGAVQQACGSGAVVV